MADKFKELCKWKSEQYVKNFDLLSQAVADSRYACVKCGRAAGKKKWLCKAEKLSVPQS